MTFATPAASPSHRPVDDRDRVGITSRGSGKGIARGTTSVAGGDRGSGGVLLNASSLAAFAQWAIWVHGDVAEGTSSATRAGPQLAVDDNAASDTGAKRKTREASCTATDAGAKLTPCGAVRVILQRRVNGSCCPMRSTMGTFVHPGR